jgi:hypothetical protein
MSQKYSNDQKPTVARKEETSRVVWVLVFVTNPWKLKLKEPPSSGFLGKKTGLKNLMFFQISMMIKVLKGQNPQLLR